jgi:citrate lyase gamma subunit
MTTTAPIDLTATRIRWSVLTRVEIERVLVDAGRHGDAELVLRARRAIARRAASV